MNWTKLSLKIKLILGFSIVTLLLLVVASIGYLALNGASSSFKEYREMARDTNLAGRLQANMLMIRMNVKNFLIAGTEDSLESYNERWEKMMQFQAQAQREIQNPRRAAVVDEIKRDLVDYKKGFNQVIEYKKYRNELVNDVLNVNGPLMEKSLTKIMMSANDDGDITAAFYAGMTMRNLLLGRLYMAKFLDTNDQAAVGRVHQEFEELEKNIKILDREIQDAKGRSLLSNIIKAEKFYLKAFDELVATIFSRNDIINNTLDRIGPDVANKVEELKLDIKKVQDEIGPRLQASNQRSVETIAGVSVFALAMGIFIVIFITKSVMQQLGSDPREIADVANHIANGNLVIKFDGSDSKNRGVYASMKLMAQNLSEMIKDITRGVQTLESSSGDLSVISEQMASNVEQTAERSNNVAAASEEMSGNMTSVAAATEQTTANLQTIVAAIEEMSSTINEIARNTAKGSQTTTQAVSTAEQVSAKVSELGKSASEISKVTETIADISEQTNLLALNATIEAARAGEAGKGFAVVAGEIKALAQQTAEATSEISDRIAGVQNNTQESVTAIQSIVGIINEINEIVTAVATAIEEQSSTTQEISINISQAASGVTEVNENVNQVSAVVAEVAMDINQVSQSADEIKSGGLQVADSTSKLTKLAQDLNEMVGRFQI